MSDRYLTVGQLRAALEGIPDETPVITEDNESGWNDWNQVLLARGLLNKHGQVRETSWRVLDGEVEIDVVLVTPYGHDDARRLTGG